MLAWLKKEQVFIESDSLGVDRPVTIGYLTKIAPDLTHLANLRNHIVNQMMLIDIATDTAIKLALHLKTAQLNAMTNGDVYIPILLHFQLYHTCLTHGSAPTQILTEVLSVKAAPKDAKLLGEFFTHMASVTNNDHCNGVFIPKTHPYRPCRARRRSK